MLELKLNIDISDRLDRAIRALVEAIAVRENAPHESIPASVENVHPTMPEVQDVAEPEPKAEPEFPKVSEDVASAKSDGISEAKPEPKPEPKAEPEPEPKAEPKPELKAEAPRGPQDDPLIPAKEAAPPKRARAKAQKKAPENVESPKPAEPSPEPEKPQDGIDEAKSGDDPMQGMSIMQAVKVITDELCQRGIDLADANARVRLRANELGLNYGSFTCLVKAVGYVEARRVALGE